MTAIVSSRDGSAASPRLDLTSSRVSFSASGPISTKETPSARLSRSRCPLPAASLSHSTINASPRGVASENERMPATCSSMAASVSPGLSRMSISPLPPVPDESSFSAPVLMSSSGEEAASPTDGPRPWPDSLRKPDRLPSTITGMPLPCDEKKRRVRFLISSMTALLPIPRGPFRTVTAGVARPPVFLLTILSMDEASPLTISFRPTKAGWPA